MAEEQAEPDVAEEQVPPVVEPEPVPEPVEPEPPQHVGGSRSHSLSRLPVGQTFVWGKDPAMARSLLAAAAETGYRPNVVRFVGNGFIVPDKVFDQHVNDTTEEF